MENKLIKVRKKPVQVRAYVANKDEFIETLEGTMKASKGDYVIIGVENERYPVRPDIFEKTYEIID